jgi:hypothetical protein
VTGYGFWAAGGGASFTLATVTTNNIRGLTRLLLIAIPRWGLLIVGVLLIVLSGLLRRRSVG